MIIWSGKGLMIAIVAVAVGAVAMVFTPLIGPSVKSALGIGLIACGAVAFLLSRREYAESRPNTLFFIPVWLWGIASAGLGVTAMVGFNLLPERSPEVKAKLDRIDAALRDHEIASSSKVGEALATKYLAILVTAARSSGGSGKIRACLELGSEDPAKATKVALYLRVEDLKKYSAEAKRGLCDSALKLLATDFPKARCSAAARGPYLWGVHGSRPPGGESAIEVSSDDPVFP